MNSQPAEAQRARRASRLTIALLAAVFLLPLALAWLVQRFGLSSGEPASYGTLVASRAVPEARLDLIDGGKFDFTSVRGKWVLLQFDAPACDAYCERKLYVMRQLRKALGADMPRIERVWLLTANGAPAGSLRAAIDGTRIARSSPALESFFAGESALADYLFLVDPLGQWMMRYPRDPDASRMLKDLQRLMKYSGSG